MSFVNISGKYFNTMLANDASLFEHIAQVVQEEPRDAGYVREPLRKSRQPPSIVPMMRETGRSGDLVQISLGERPMSSEPDRRPKSNGTRAQTEELAPPDPQAVPK
jgi:hypothetical protein